jgi:hypothetical protein
MLVKTSELIDTSLDYAVAKCEGQNPRIVIVGSAVIVNNDGRQSPSYSTDWSQGGPIIEKEEINLRMYYTQGAGWFAFKKALSFKQAGPTPLIAAMRCLVASKMGDNVEIPDELLK